MNRYSLRRLGSAMCAVAVLFWLAAAYFIASAAASSGNGTIKIICKTDSSAIYGMRMNAYRVGSLTEDTIVFEGDFEEYPVYLPDLTASSLQDAAYTLENYAVIDGITPDSTGTTDESGIIRFSGLENGVYLVAGVKLSIGTKVYVPIPMLIDVTDGEIVSAVEKFEVRDKPTVNRQLYRVRKVWQYDDSSLYIIPASIDVAIYCDGEYVETVTLGKSNDWVYQWSGDPNCDWRVKELNITRNYKVVYRNNETQFLVENSQDVLYNTVTTSTTTSTTTTSATTVTEATTAAVTNTETSVSSTTAETSSAVTETTVLPGTEETVSSSSATTSVTTGSTKLPQTGQLWWPVPVCGAAGIVLFAAGWRLNKKD